MRLEQGQAFAGDLGSIRAWRLLRASGFPLDLHPPYSNLEPSFSRLMCTKERAGAQTYLFLKKNGEKPNKQTTKPSKQDTNRAVLNMLSTIKAQFSEGQTTNLLTTRMSLWHGNLRCNSDRLSWGSCMACPGLVQELWSSLPCIAHGQLLPWPCALHCVNSSFYTDVLLYYIGYQGRLRNAGYLFHPTLFLFHIYAA